MQATAVEGREGLQDLKATRRVLHCLLKLSHPGVVNIVTMQLPVLWEVVEIEWLLMLLGKQ